MLHARRCSIYPRNLSTISSHESLIALLVNSSFISSSVLCYQQINLIHYNSTWNLILKWRRILTEFSWRFWWFMKCTTDSYLANYIDDCRIRMCVIYKEWKYFYYTASGRVLFKITKDRIVNITSIDSRKLRRISTRLGGRSINSDLFYCDECSEQHAVSL